MLPAQLTLLRPVHHSEALPELIFKHNEERCKVGIFKLVSKCGNVIHYGSKGECELILSGFVAYGLDESDFSIIFDNSNPNKEV